MGCGAMCTQQGRRRTGPFALPEGDPVQDAGAPDPRAAGAPFTSMELEKELEGDLRGTNHRDKKNFLRGGLPPEGSRTVTGTGLEAARVARKLKMSDFVRTARSTSLQLYDVQGSELRTSC